MQAERFYYSRDGTVTEGPVAWADLGLLYRQGVLGPGSFVCPEGGSEWTPFDVGWFPVALPPPPSPPPAVVPPAPPPAYPYDPSSRSRRRRRSSDDDSGGVGAKIADGIAAVIAIGCAIFTAAITHPSGTAITDSLSFRAGAFVGALIFICLVPCLVCLFFRNLTRAVVRCLGIAAIGLLSVGGNLHRIQQAEFIKTATEMSDQIKADAKKQIAAKGYYVGDPDRAQQNLEKLKSMASGDSATARGERDLADVMSGLFAKVKVAQADELACNFKVGDISTQADLAARRQAIEKLRGAQKDVVALLQNFDSSCRDVMTKDNLPPATVDALIDGARRGGHMDTLVQLWQGQVKLSDDYLARLDFLDKCYGSWTTRDGKVIFTDNDSLAAFNNFVLTLQADAKQVKDLQARIVQ